MGFETLQNIVADCAVQNPMEMIGGPKKEAQTENIRFADKAGQGSHVGAINVNSSSARLLEACFLLVLQNLDPLQHRQHFVDPSEFLPRFAFRLAAIDFRRVYHLPALIVQQPDATPL